MVESDKRILLHAGGQTGVCRVMSPSGENTHAHTRFSLGTRTETESESFYLLQLPLYERILSQAPQSLHTLIASGDVYIRSDKPLQPIPEADAVCYGLWVDPSLATHHGYMF